MENEKSGALQQLIKIAKILGVAVILIAIAGFLIRPSDNGNNVNVGDGTNITDNKNGAEEKVAGGVRNCIGSVLDKAPSCSDCENVFRKTKFLNNNTTETCRGVSSQGGDRCALECK